MHRALVLLVCVTLAGCDRPQASDARQLASRALRGALSYPGSAMVSIAAGTDAAEVKLTTGDPVERVADWFRQTLTMNGWELRNEGRGADGVITIYAEKRDGRPLWLTLKPNVGGPGTSYTLIGAVIEPDSSAAAAPKP